MGRMLRRYDIFLVIVLFLAAIPLERAEVFALLEDQTLSIRHMLRNSLGDVRGNRIVPDIVLVNTDEAFFKAYGSFPFRRTDIGRIAENVKALGAKVVAVDVLMDFPSSYGEDPPTAESLKAAGKVLLVAQAEFRDGKFVKVNPPTAALDAVALSAYTNISSSSSLVTNLSRLRVHPELTAHRGGWPFAVMTAAMYLGVEPRLDGRTLVLGDIRIPLDRFNSLFIDFPPLPTGTRFLSQSAGISALDFLDISKLDDNEREELSLWVKDKIVLIGDTSEVSHDWFDTPVGMVYGVEIIADTVNTILKGAPLRPLSDGLEVLSVLAVMLLLLAVGLLSSPLARAVGVAVILAGFAALATAAYVHWGVVASMSYVLIAGALGFLAVEYRQFMLARNQRQQIARTFGQYIPAELVKEMARTGETVSVGGENREMTVLFSDVRSFTTLSEGLSPQELTRMMNGFLSPMTRVIHQHRGTIDKYMGDCIMAFWGAPLEDPDHARHAVEAALAMNGTLEEVNRNFREKGWKSIGIGIGLNTGSMNVGNMGSDFRLAYTVLGDAVNLGSRLEGLTKQYGVMIMISESTFRAVPGLVARELDVVRVKGKDKPVTVYEPIGFAQHVDPSVLVRLERYHAALELYRRQKWDEARREFQAMAKAEPETKVHKVYLERIDHFIAEPPGEGWDGVFTHTSK